MKFGVGCSWYSGTVPGQGASRSAEVVADCTRCLGVRELGRRLGVSHVSVRRYRDGTSPVPSALLEQLERIRSEAAEPSPVDVLMAQVADSPGVLTPRSVRGRGSTHARALEQLLAAGDVVIVCVATADRSGRRYQRPRLFPQGAAPRPPAVRSIDSDWMRERLGELGRPPKWLAAQLALSPSTVRGMLSGHLAVPQARQEELVRVLEPEVTGEEVRSARSAAGWTLAQFGEQAGVKWQQVAGWERGVRRVPPARMPAVRRAVADARRAAQAGDRQRETVATVVAWVGDHPGAPTGRVRHRYHEGRWAEALETALREGLVVEHVAPAPGHPRAQRRLPRLFLRESPPASSEVLLGGELRRQREQRGLELRDLAPYVGVTAGAISSWERRADQQVPPWHVAALRRGLDGATPGRPTGVVGRRGRAVLTEREARDRIVVALGQGPLTRTELFGRVGRSPTVLAQLEELQERRTIVEAPGHDRFGRPRTLLALPRASSGPAPGVAPFGDGELRAQRQALGLTIAELAERVGVSPSKVSQYETGSRRIPAPRLAALREALEQGPPDRPDPVQREATLVLEELRRRPEGLTTTELGLGKTAPREHRLEAVRRLVEAGEAHWAETAAWRADGRSYRRRVLRAGPPLSAPPPLVLTGRQLRALMDSAGVNQTVLAGRLGVGQASVSRWAIDGPPAGRVPALLEALAAAPTSADVDHQIDHQTG